MQVIYDYIPEKNQVSSFAALQYLQFVLQVTLFRLRIMIIIIIIIIIIIPVITFMQTIYNYTPEINHVSTV